MIDKLKKKIGLTPVYRPQYSSQFVTVFSHPRSGTHFLEAFLAENFYKSEDLYLENVAWGHWGNRQVLKEGNKYGKLFGSHLYPESYLKKIDYPIIYIYRDVRSVAYSIWKTENFIHPSKKSISFSEFLRMKIDWIGSPAFKCREKFTIIEHWLKHVEGWIDLSNKNKNILVIKYEELVKEPYQVYLKIHNDFFIDQDLLSPEEVNPIQKPVGLLPNEAQANSWSKIFNEEDLLLISGKVKSKYLIS